MMQFNKKQFKKNKWFLIASSIIVLIMLLVTLLLSGYEQKLIEEELSESGQSAVSKLVINEIMSSNGGAYADKNGELNDWVEFYNGSSKDINLKNYGLSDEENTVKWVFPEHTIKPGEYLVVNLSGKKQEGLYASFKLSSAGKEVLALKNPSGKVIDAIETIPLDKNQVMVRDLKGKFIKSSLPTPGFVNTKEGYDKYHNSLKDLKSDIKINEVLPRNSGNFKNKDNIYSGYIEIINTGSKNINIKNYSISNTISAPFKFQLPDKTLKPNEVLVIYTDTLNSDNYIYSNFKLQNKNGDAILTNNLGKIIDSVSYSNLANGMGLVRSKDKLLETSQISPNYLNDTNGVKKFSEEYLKNENTLIINEVMNSNSSFLAQNGNEFYDWIELKNNSNKDINLSDYTLTTNSEITMYQLPDKVLKPNELYIVMASGDSNLSNTSYKHANFKLSDNESLYIMKGKKITDAMFISNIPIGYSMGRNNNNGFYYISSPTPNIANGSGVLEIAYNVSYNKKPGIYNNSEGFNLELASNGTIYYSLDGSVPTKLYNGPLFINKTTVVKVMNKEENKINSEIATLSYIINENHTLPVMSVSLKQSDFNRVENSPGSDIEVSANAELYENGKNFTIPCGFKLFGGSTRYLAKKSFALKFRKQYGEASLNYQVFDNRDFSKFDTLILRSGSQDSEAAFMRDILMTSLADKVTNLDVQSYKSVILYINGKYHGIYNIREKVDETFISNHYNVDESSSIVRIDNELTTGSTDSYRHVVNYINNNNMATTKNYEYIKTKLDVESLANFWASEIWVTNNDIINTRFFSHPKIDNGKLKLIFYDLDYAMYNYSVNYYNFMLQPEGMSDFKVTTEMMRGLIKNSEFKKLLLERVTYQVKNVWNQKRVDAKIDELYNMFKPEMERNQKRWNMTYKHWEDSVNDLKKYSKNRNTYLKSQTKSFFNLSTSEVEKIFGG